MGSPRSYNEKSGVAYHSKRELFIKIPIDRKSPAANNKIRERTLFILIHQAMMHTSCYFMLSLITLLSARGTQRTDLVAPHTLTWVPTGEAAGPTVYIYNRTQQCEYFAMVHWRSSCVTIGGQGDSGMVSVPPSHLPTGIPTPSSIVLDKIEIYEWDETTLVSTYDHCNTPGWSPSSVNSCGGAGCGSNGIVIEGNGVDENAITCGV